MKKLGFFKKIGISIYDFKTLETILNKKLKIDFVQLPYNVFDQRFSNKRLINKLKKRKVEIHARSIFLQGLLVAQNIHLPKRLNKLGKAILKWNLWLSEKNINPVHACLDFVLRNKNIDKIVVGLNSINNFKDILKFKRTNANFDKFIIKIDKSLLDPRTW